MQQIPVLCPEWHKRLTLSEDEQLTYVGDELRRVDKLGAPVLTVALASLDGAVQGIALAMLAGELQHPAGGLVVQPRLWRLRLRRDAQPPHTDPQGRPLDDERRGNVLVAKVGNHGSHVNLSTQKQVSAAGRTEFCGEVRAQLAASGGDLYKTVDIGRDWTDVTIQTAVLVLRQWGIGVQRQRYRTRPGWRPGMPQEPGQDRWLVEEYCAATTQRADKPAKD